MEKANCSACGKQSVIMRICPKCGAFYCDSCGSSNACGLCYSTKSEYLDYADVGDYED